MNSCGCMTRAEREEKIRFFEETLATWKAQHDPRANQLEQMIATVKADNQAIIDAGESCMHGLPGNSCESSGPFDLIN